VGSRGNGIRRSGQPCRAAAGVAPRASSEPRRSVRRSSPWPWPLASHGRNIVLAFIDFLWHYARRYRGSVAIVACALLVENAFAIVVPLCFQRLVDAALNQSFADVIPTGFAGLLLGLIAGSAAGVGRDYVFARLGASILDDIRLDMFDRLQRMSMSYYDRTPIGDIVARFSTDLATLQNVIVYSLPYFGFYL